LANYHLLGPPQVSQSFSKGRLQWEIVLACHWLGLIILATWEAERGRVMMEVTQANSLGDAKITREKWTGGVAQVV
jgi:hypothetical protein